tara:strand:+ start:85912 stop:86277 length:366 start_codon:yes stop_codon:yes gene_type:complete
LRASLHILAISITIGIGVLSLVKPPTIEVSVSNFDKLLHVFAYFCLATSWLMALRNRNKPYLIIVGCVIYGIVIEMLQLSMTDYRTGDLNDVLANTTGAIIGFLLFNYLNKNILLKTNQQP